MNPVENDLESKKIMRKMVAIRMEITNFEKLSLPYNTCNVNKISVVMRIYFVQEFAHVAKWE
jgi:hypothetical protein